jgi:3-hydroxyacyl-CoA dehydrogenase
MISQLIDLLQLDEFYGQSERIDTAMGRYEYPTTWKSFKQLIKRIWYGRKDNSGTRT